MPAAKLGIFLAGVQKSGTTSLFHYMAAHPELAAPRVKETHHFDNEALDWSQNNSPVLDAFFHRQDAARRRFDATPIYLFWPPSLARIRAYHPKAKLVFLFRDPIERAYAHWRMEVARGTEHLSFSDAIGHGRSRLSPSHPLDIHWRDQSYVERGFYGHQLARALSLFPREQMLFLKSEDLRDRHTDLLARLAAFLAIRPFPPLAPRGDNQATPSPHLQPVTERDHAHLRDVFRDDLAHFAALSGLAVERWWTMRRFTEPHP